jgi:hypothetical protein
VNNHHKALIAQDSKIESANKRLKAANASVNRAEERLFEAQRRATNDPGNERLRSDLEKVTKTQANAGDAYTKAVDASISTVGTGSGRVMVLLPPQVADNTRCK